MIKSSGKVRSKKEYWAFEDIITGEELEKKIKDYVSGVLDGQNVMVTITILKMLDEEIRVSLKSIIKEHNVYKKNLELVDNVLNKNCKRWLTK